VVCWLIAFHVVSFSCFHIEYIRFVHQHTNLCKIVNLLVLTLIKLFGESHLIKLFVVMCACYLSNAALSKRLQLVQFFIWLLGGKHAASAGEVNMLRNRVALAVNEPKWT
jgi:hypothetical protein